LSCHVWLIADTISIITTTTTKSSFDQIYFFSLNLHRRNFRLLLPLTKDPNLEVAYRARVMFAMMLETHVQSTTELEWEMKQLAEVVVDINESVLADALVRFEIFL
jgi:tryptophan 2,3-dioxygenase